MMNTDKLFKNFTKNYVRLLVIAGISVCLVTGLTACDLASNHLKMDREKSLTFQDFRDGLAPRELPEKVEPDSDIPSMQSYVASPSKNLKAMPLVSISVNQTVPLREALFELAKEADYDIELDSNITGSVIFSARNKPFDVVLDRLTEMAGLRYKIDDNTIRIEEDRPFMFNYKLDYLNYVRESSSSISSSTDVVSGGGADTGSEFSSSSSSSSDFWADLETGLTQVLGVEALTGSLRSSFTPAISALDTSGEPGIAAQPAGSDVVVQVSSLPAVGPDAATAGSGQEALFAMNRHAGIISVYAPQRKHKEVKEYLDQVRRSSTAQVLIEAKVIEVELSEEYALGINWTDLFPNSNSLSFDVDATTQNFLVGAREAGEGLSLAYTNWDISTAIDAISQFGTTRALSSPRITVLNNQPAALNVATNLVYFEVQIDVEPGEDGERDTITVESTINNVPEGVLINVLPSINLEEQKISLALRPTITNVDEFRDDPVVGLTLAMNSDILEAADRDEILESLRSQIPVVEVQEFDSVIELNSGQAIIMGGLMQDRVQSRETGVPVLSEIPGIGNAFKNHSDVIQKLELVVILKATIIENNNNIHETDREIYEMFASDRRPFDF